MKFTTITAVFATAGVVVADSCNRGGVYCGSSLLRKGKPPRQTLIPTFSVPPTCNAIHKTRNYRDHIKETLQAAGVSTDERHIQNSKFDCLSDGDIAYREFCSNGCGGTDSTDPDYCL
ncbi:hypothetical protein DL767_005585 [Monosporascus sp. MG133]|nr:hypothetical protein DL767_005585 [Monosporascus sp. MG133]